MIVRKLITMISFQVNKSGLNILALRWGSSGKWALRDS